MRYDMFRTPMWATYQGTREDDFVGSMYALFEGVLSSGAAVYRDRFRIVEEYEGDDRNPPHVVVRAMNGVADANDAVDTYSLYGSSWGWFFEQRGDEFYIEPYA